MAVTPPAGVEGGAAFTHHVTAGGRKPLERRDPASMLLSELANMAMLVFLSLPQTEPLLLFHGF